MKRALRIENEIGRALERTHDACDRAARREADPVGFVHRYSDPLDQELVALLAATMAFGSVKVIRRKIDEVLERIELRPVDASESLPRLQKALAKFRHRVFIGDDLARLLFGARALQLEHGSLGGHFESILAAQNLSRFASKNESASSEKPSEEEYERFRDSIRRLARALRDAGGIREGGPRRGPAHLLPNETGSGGMKRFLLFLRWMIRPNDDVDLGIWRVDPAILVCPVDVHIHRLATNLGWTKRKGADWTTALDVTRALARHRPKDPVAYDFALCHLGMLQNCPSRRDEVRCEGCGIRPVCRHWVGRSA